ncbi:hypothetical protein TNCV_4263881 [Trichonephila clavipes]|nr:hypothetical protein TNCV_4263881 [Trichonephila clavipes]
MSQFTLCNFPPSQVSSLAPNPPYFADYVITPIADRDSDRFRISPVRIPQSSWSPSHFYSGRDLTRAPSKIQSPSRWRGFTTAPSKSQSSLSDPPLYPLSLIPSIA